MSISIKQFLTDSIRKDICTYAFANQGNEDVIFGVELTATPRNYTHLSEVEHKDGFVFAPFDTDTHKSYFIEQQIADLSVESYKQIANLPDKKKYCKSTIFESSYSDYYNQINKMLEALKADKLKKVILSRIKFVENEGRTIAVDLFLKMVKAYPDAFVFMVNIPDIGLWLGASPEQLVHYADNQLYTVALAGTQHLGNKTIEQIIWQEKEIEEQAWVARYIDRLFCDYNITDIEKKGASTVKAGGVVHLKTIYKANVNNWRIAVDFATQLHPTPAICGLPKTIAKQLIRDIEQHQRNYYAGYLGEVKSSGEFSLFVNLRSMQVLNNGVALFVGGGITAQSDAEKEWQETCYKAETMLKILQ